MTALEVAAAVAASPKKAAKKTTQAAKVGAKKPKAPASHPPVSQMVLAAVGTLKDRKGTSLAAIKKYISVNYKCDVVKLALFIRKALKACVENGTLVQTKGNGANGLFKLKAVEKKAAEKKPPAPKRGAGEKTVKKTAGAKSTKPVTKKATGTKKIQKSTAKTSAIAKKSAPAAQKAASVKKTVASKQKSTKPSKTAAKPPKTAKAKKTVTTKQAAPKKATARK